MRCVLSSRKWWTHRLTSTLMLDRETGGQGHVERARRHGPAGPSLTARRKSCASGVNTARTGAFADRSGNRLKRRSGPAFPAFPAAGGLCFDPPLTPHINRCARPTVQFQNRDYRGWTFLHEARSRLLRSYAGGVRHYVWRQRAGVTAPGRQISPFALNQAAIFGSQLPQNRFEAIAAPSLNTANFAQTTSGSTPPDPAWIEKPQSHPAMTESRPTRSA